MPGTAAVRRDGPVGKRRDTVFLSQILGHSSPAITAAIY
jgi:hypothetical protein